MEARLLFVAMWCWADDYGVGETNLLGLRAFAFPEEDPYLSKEIPCLCKEVADAYGVRFYRVGRRAYYQILSWDSHQKTQRRAKDKNPHYDDPDAQVDERFHRQQGTSVHEQGSSAQVQGKCIDGNGNGNGRGKGNGTTSPPAASPPPARDTTEPGTFPILSKLPKANGRYAYPAPFSEWWKAYPKHKNGSMQDAYTEWQKAVKRIAPDDLLRLTTAYAGNPGVSSVDYCPDAHRWLKTARWETVTETDHTITVRSQANGYSPEEWLAPPEDPGDYIEGEVIEMRGIGS